MGKNDFSARNGFVKSNFDSKSFDIKCRNRLWNFVNNIAFQKESIAAIIDKLGYEVDSSDMKNWETLRHIFISGKNEWYVVYDALEFLYQEYRKERRNEDGTGYEKSLNELLDDIGSSYKMHFGRFIKRFDSLEEETIERVSESKFTTSKESMRKALYLFSERRNPDYHNAVKEAISAVESAGKILVGDKNESLGDVVKELKKQGKIPHPSLGEAIKKLYGYASDEDGIRHGSPNGENVTEYEARFMIVTCSAVLNYFEGIE